MKTNEDELLKPLFNKVGMEKAPEDITMKVMEQIMVNPEIETVRRFHYDWLWAGIGLLSLLSMYFTGVLGFVYNLFAGSFIKIYSVFAVYAGELTGLLPSNVIILPSSYVLPLILPGILFIILVDSLFGKILLENKVR